MTTQELTVIEQSPAPLTVFGTDDPTAIVARVSAIATPLAEFIKRQKMSTSISGREYVLAEGWAFMGAMLGVSPVVTSVAELRNPEGNLIGFEAHAELRTRDGSVVGGAIAECTFLEANWGDRDTFALKSMAQTRAVGKAYRMAFGFVMKAAGYEATPAEEMVAPAAPRVPAPYANERRPVEALATNVPTRDANGDRAPSKDDEILARVGEALKGAGMVRADLTPVIGTPSRGSITQWLADNSWDVEALIKAAVGARETLAESAQELPEATGRRRS